MISLTKIAASNYLIEECIFRLLRKFYDYLWQTPITSHKVSVHSKFVDVAGSPIIEIENWISNDKLLCFFIFSL